MLTHSTPHHTHSTPHNTHTHTHTPHHTLHTTHTHTHHTLLTYTHTPHTYTEKSWTNGLQSTGKYNNFLLIYIFQVSLPSLTGALSSDRVVYYAHSIVC